MGWVSGLVVYAVTWWIVLLAVLPWGAAPPEEVERGHATSAPARPRLGLKFLITTVIAAVIWLIIFALIEANVFSFRDWAEQIRT